MPEFRLGLDRFLFFVRREYQFVLATFAASGIGYLGSAAAPAIVNALIAAETMTGINGTTKHALPHERLVKIMKKYNRG